jgi:hypothetical protein
MRLTTEYNPKCPKRLSGNQHWLVQTYGHNDLVTKRKDLALAEARRRAKELGHAVYVTLWTRHAYTSGYQTSAVVRPAKKSVTES